MNLLKKVQINFNNASKSYDDVATIQKYVAEKLVSKLLEIKNFTPKTILDIGTGTGYIPELLLPNYPKSTYLVSDIALEMLKVCKTKFLNRPNIHYLIIDMAQMNLVDFDLIISNLALQWADDLWNTIERFYSKTSQIFTFSTLLNGTFIEWETLINRYQNIKLQNYPCSDELISFCHRISSKQNFNYWIMEIPITFDNPLIFMRYLKLLGASASNDSTKPSNLHLLIRERNEPLTVTYKIFCGIFNKFSA